METLCKKELIDLFSFNRRGLSRVHPIMCYFDQIRDIMAQNYWRVIQAEMDDKTNES